ncbi:MAG TPA: pyridoxal phosphate-dependent aminotransferase [Vicinamibacterales bacterium]|nr:pyridoxal phosphate-dependent aminotransferase [Vicinamibacterales bacterium]
MTFPELAYIGWAKALPSVKINLARSGIDHCPPSLLRLTASDLVTTLPVKYGYAPLRDAIARRYGVGADQVFTVSGGASFANWIACAAAVDGAPRHAEAIVEQPTYEPLLKIVEALGCRIRRLDRRFDDGYAIDLDRFRSIVTARTRLAIVTNLHNPSGARIDWDTLTQMAAIMARVKGVLLVDEVYLECVFRSRPQSCVHAGPNVITTNSLTKAYGLDGLRAGWMLGPAALVRRAGTINDIMTNNGVAPGERMALAAFRHRRDLDRRAHALLDPNLERLRAFFARESRLQALVPPGGNVAFPRLPRGIGGDALCAHLLKHYSTLVVPGRFFESPQHIRISFGTRPAIVARGLANISRAIDDLEQSVDARMRATDVARRL